MAYSRWSNSNIYAFHYDCGSAAKADQQLSIWCNGAKERYRASYAECCEMLESQNLNSIPGLIHSDTDLVLDILRRFLRDIDDDYLYSP